MVMYSMINLLGLGPIYVPKRPIDLPLNIPPLQVCSLPGDGARFRELVPEGGFESTTEVLRSLDPKSIMSAEFLVLFEDSSLVHNLAMALRQISNGILI